MKIGMVLYDIQEFGGLEEYAVALAHALEQDGHKVCVISAAWTAEDNQYVRSLRAYGIPLLQPPRWVSALASDWGTKERVLSAVLKLALPVVYLLAAARFLSRKRPWHVALASSRNWLQGRLMDHVIGPDRRRVIGRLLLNWCRLRWHPDLLHIHGYTTSLLFAIDWADRQHVPAVYEEHQTPDASFDWWKGFSHSINKATVVVAVSNASADALRTVCGVTRPIRVRGPVVADPAEAGWSPTLRVQGPGDPIRVSTVARLYVTKGLTYLLDVVVKVRAVYPQTRFRVYGDGVLRAELLSRAANMGLDGSEIFVGAIPRSELPGVMAETDIFLLTSILEGQPLAVAEAMAFGCPIVATSVGGIPEVIEDGANGLLCPPADPECLAQKVVTLIADPELRSRLGDAARRSYEASDFPPACASRQLLNIYEEALRLHSDRDGSAWQEQTQSDTGKNLERVAP